MLRPPPTSTLFPYTTLFRSGLDGVDLAPNLERDLLVGRRSRARALEEWPAQRHEHLALALRQADGAIHPERGGSLTYVRRARVTECQVDRAAGNDVAVRDSHLASDPLAVDERPVAGQAIVDDRPHPSNLF